jgi:hypothetical protein
MSKLYRVARLQQDKWCIEIDMCYPIGSNWHMIAKHSSKRLLTIIVNVLNRLDRDF